MQNFMSKKLVAFIATIAGNVLVLALDKMLGIQVPTELKAEVIALLNGVAYYYLKTQGNLDMEVTKKIKP
jgi:hypothetical protein